MIKVYSLGIKLEKQTESLIKRELAHIHNCSEDNIKVSSIRFFLKMNSDLVRQVKDKLIPLLQEANSEPEHKKLPPYILLPGVSVAAGLVIAVVKGFYSVMPRIIELTRAGKDFWVFKSIHDLEKVSKISNKKN